MLDRNPLRGVGQAWAWEAGGRPPLGVGAEGSPQMHLCSGWSPALAALGNQHEPHGGPRGKVSCEAGALRAQEATADAGEGRQALLVPRPEASRDPLFSGSQLL